MLSDAWTVPEYGSVGDDAYRAMGLRCGLEVHGQLLTVRKLFCRCPAGRTSPSFDMEIRRHLRPTLPPNGPRDAAADRAIRMHKEIRYLLDGTTVCTYEMDDAPPFELDEQSLDIAIDVALRVGAMVVDELHVCRKPYLDGSIPSGFQRTALLGLGGSVSLDGRSVRIKRVALEEDTCREVSDVGHVRTFQTDRMGTPLVEIAAAIDLETPGESAAVARLLTNLTHATGNVRRGVGTSRYDVHVSVAGGSLVEIKDVSRIGLIAPLVHGEAYRQVALLRIRDVLKARAGAGPDRVAADADVSGMFAGTAYEPVAQALHDGGAVRAVCLSAFAGLLTQPTQPSTVFEQEFADRVRVIACLHGRPNLVSSDQPTATLSAREWERVRRRVGARPADAVIVTWGPADDVTAAVEAIRTRAAEALLGVPRETRRASVDGTTTFSEVPTAGGIHPDTDLPPTVISRQRVSRIAATLAAVDSISGEPAMPAASGTRTNDAAGRGDLTSALHPARFDVDIWSEVQLRTDAGEFVGLIVPRRNDVDDGHIVLKLDGGYRVGLHASRIAGTTVVGRCEPEDAPAPPPSPPRSDLPRVRLLGTGGTIATRLEERTGTAMPAMTPADLCRSVPELTAICNLEGERLYSLYSENMGPAEWIGIANACARAIDDGVDGIVIAHGTDTMHHTAAALSFMLQKPPVPIVMVGSQRSSDRPSSDAALNLIYAAKTAAESDIAEVMVCMFGPTSDEYGLLHRGTRVRKMHASYRSTFRTIGDRSLGMVDTHGARPMREDYHRRDPSRAGYRVEAVFDDRVAIVYYYPGMKCDVIDALIEHGYRGIVIAGTGLGHVNHGVFPALARARDAGVAMYMTVQTLWGYTQMYVYPTGREIMSLGVVPAANMLTDVAYVKLGWALARHADPADVRRTMLTPLAGEITDREPPDGYLVYQGGMPIMKQLRTDVHR